MNRLKLPPTALPAGSLYVTVAAFTLACLPTFFRFPPWLALLLLVLLGWRVAITRWGWRTPWGPLLLALCIASAWGVQREYGTLLGRDGGTAVLVILVACKLLEVRTRRDALVVLVLGYFVTASHFFFAQEALSALHALLATSALTTALLAWRAPSARHGRKSGQELWLLGRQSLRLLGQAAPLTLVLFVVFPRPDGPLWQMPVVSTQATTGLSDEVTPGSVSSLAQDSAVAFRATFEGNAPAPVELYWRAYVHEAFDGHTWRRTRPEGGLPTVRALSRPHRYTLTLEPNGKPVVFTLDVPASLPPRTAINANLQVALSRPPSIRTRVALDAVTHYRYGLDASREQLARNLFVPPGGNPQARALAGRWRALSPEKRVEAALEFFGSGGYRYTLDPPLLPLNDPMDALLFATRQGFCEHYAGAFAYLMRLSGVPARLVTGYQGGQDNGGYLIVRQANAHAWAEVWLAGEGWRRVVPDGGPGPGTHFRRSLGGPAQRRAAGHPAGPAGLGRAAGIAARRPASHLERVGDRL